MHTYLGVSSVADSFIKTKFSFLLRETFFHVFIYFIYFSNACYIYILMIKLVSDPDFKS